MVVKYSDIVEANGKTIRQNNMNIKHKFVVGDLVEADITIYNERDGSYLELKGKCKLFVVMCARDCDGTPLYCLADIPVVYPSEAKIFSNDYMVYHTFAKICQHGYSENNLKHVGQAQKMYSNVKEYFGM